MKSTNSTRWLVLLLVVSLVGGCGGGKGNRKIDYESARTLPPLEIPPDLSSLPPGTESTGAAIPPSAATYSTFEAEQKKRGVGPQIAGLLPRFDNIRLERAANQRWLVANMQPEQLWPQIRIFLANMGLTIAKQQPETGILETDWAENRAKVQSRMQVFFSKITGQGYGTNLRDKYRVRLEHGENPGTTEIFVSHRGMEQFRVNVDTKDEIQPAVWQTRPSDPELEIEMLRLLMVHLGATQTQADAAIAAEETPERARLGRNESGYPALSLSDSLERAWRRVGLSLDRIGFTVEDRDRSKWTYYVRYIDPEEDTKKKKKKRKKKKQISEEYRVALRAADEGTSVEVLDNNGSPGPEKTSEQILSLLYEQLK